MKFAAIIEYLQDKAKIAEIRPVHRQYLASLKQKGQLAISGPFTDDSGALIVYEASSAVESGHRQARSVAGVTTTRNINRRERRETQRRGARTISLRSSATSAVDV